MVGHARHSSAPLRSERSRCRSNRRIDGDSAIDPNDSSIPRCPSPMPWNGGPPHWTFIGGGEGGGNKDAARLKRSFIRPSYLLRDSTRGWMPTARELLSGTHNAPVWNSTSSRNLRYLPATDQSEKKEGEKKGLQPCCNNVTQSREEYLASSWICETRKSDGKKTKKRIRLANLTL